MKSLTLFVGLLCTLQLFDSTSCGNVIEKGEREMVDPHSLYYNKQQKKVIINDEYGIVHDESHAIELRYENENCQTNRKDERSYEVFARRLINMLIKNSKLKVDEDKASGSVNLEATLDELEILMAFGNGKSSIRQLDGIISNVLKSPEVNVFEEMISYTDMLGFYLYEHRRTFLSLLFCMIIIPIIIKGTRTKLGIITLLFAVMTIISFVMTWQQLIQDAEIQMAVQRSMYSARPDECKYSSLGFFGSLKLFVGIGKGDCLKFYETIMKDPMLEVTPTQAFMHMCTKSVSYPVLLFGKEYSQFIDNMTDSLPWWIQPVAKPLIYFLTLLLIYGIIFLSFGGKVGLRVGPLFHFYIHGRDSAESLIGFTTNDRQTIEILRSEIRDVASVVQIWNQTEPNSEESRDVTNRAQTQTQKMVSISPKNKETPKKTAEKSIQVEKIDHQEPKPEESDSNSDEFLEDEYEKISKRRIETEMSRSRIEILENESSTKKKEESKPRSKKLLEIGGGDS